MRRSLPLALAALAVLCSGQAARAFHHCCHHGYQPVAFHHAPVAAPLSLGNVLQIAQTGLQVLSGLDQAFGGAGAGRQQQQPPPPPPPQKVPSDVQDTITRVDQALQTAVNKSDDIAKLNPLYKDFMKINDRKTSPPAGSGTTGGPRVAGSESAGPG